MDHGFEYLFHGKNAAVAVDLHGVFSGITSRSFHDHHQDFIDHCIVVIDKSIMNRMAFGFFYLLFSAL